MEFVEFPKLSRLNREVIVTEKIDGTNAQVVIVDKREVDLPRGCTIVGDLAIGAGSRTRYITPEDDNYGFARWVQEHAEELATLGRGHHFGEWWGLGIQRGYGLKEKRFSLFNVHRWANDAVRPACCHVVPELGRGLLIPYLAMLPDWLETLRTEGSKAAPGFMRPEGIVVFHVASNTGFKYTFDKNDGHKGSP